MSLEEIKTGEGAQDGRPKNVPAEAGAVPPKEARVGSSVFETSTEVPAPSSPDTIPQISDSPAEPLFSGEAKLIISPPVRMDTVLKLYNYLQTLPDVKLVYTSGAKDAEVAITISIDKPTSITKLLSKIDGVTIVPENGISRILGGSTRPLFERKKSPAREIKLVFKE